MASKDCEGPRICGRMKGNVGRRRECFGMGLVLLVIFAASLATAPAAVARSKNHGFWGWFWAAFFALALAFLANVIIGLCILVLFTVGTLSMSERRTEARATPYYGLHRPPAPVAVQKPPPQVQRLPQAAAPIKRGRTKTKQQTCASCSNLIGVGQWAYCPLCGSRDLILR